MTFYSRTKKTKKTTNGDLNEIVLKFPESTKECSVFSLPFSLNIIMFLDGYKSKVISFQMLSKTWFIRKYNHK